MTRDEIDILWQRAMQQAVEDGEMFTRYHFAAMVADAEREACAQVCDRRYMGDNTREDMEARRCAEAIRAKKD
jgi:hypothetical protein